jgi:Zn-dependent peptidase ImmA (M78 family)
VRETRKDKGMETLSIGGRRYSDPDIISLARQTGELICPRFTVRMQARLLLQELQNFSGLPKSPLERLQILASLKGIKIKAMDIEAHPREKRDAVLYHTESGWLILYNPNRPARRVLFTIAHEIIHTLFPNSVNGARFRTITNPDSREANELERLCDLGAAELVMPLDEFQKQAARKYTLLNVEALADYFGTSLEATVYRLASAHPGFAVAGLLQYRRKRGEERKFRLAQRQPMLFSKSNGIAMHVADKKYRRQSLHLSEQCGDDFIIRWNKSFDLSSVVYQASTGGIVTEYEELPNLSSKKGRIEAMLAPFQSEDADPEFGDVLFFWEGN